MEEEGQGHTKLHAGLDGEPDGGAGDERSTERSMASGRVSGRPLQAAASPSGAPSRSGHGLPAHSTAPAQDTAWLEVLPRDSEAEAERLKEVAGGGGEDEAKIDLRFGGRRMRRKRRRIETGPNWRKSDGRMRSPATRAGKREGGARRRAGRGREEGFAPALHPSHGHTTRKNILTGF